MSRSRSLLAWLLLPLLASLSFLALGEPLDGAAQALHLLGYIGALPVFPWIHALIWAFHDSVTVDIRRFPRQQQEATEAEIARLKAEDRPKHRRVEVQRAPATAPTRDDATE